MVRRGEFLLGVEGCLPMGFSMFDWPEPSHTSPTRMLVRVLVSPDVMTRDCGVKEAFNLPSFTSHLPSASARVDLLWPANFTATSAPGAAQPQTGTACCCWSTMLSPKMAGSFNAAASAECASANFNMSTAPAIAATRR